MLDAPIAHHITFGTYGTRLHGDPRLTVDRRHNQYGTPFVDEDADREEWAAEAMRYPRVRLSEVQRRLIESAIERHCAELGWTYHIAGAQPDHVHLLVTVTVDAKIARRLIKRRLSQSLNDHERREVWWAKGGSTKWIWKPEYFSAAFQYIERQRTTP